ncbi:MAG: leucyl/phenylalanyl-tRNA--protein transferase [Muribaculaceae bacterium]|nr:leucyl/phenylalanyl-tRNA--protein transferase [Muribaculaceae bacterium]
MRETLDLSGLEVEVPSDEVADSLSGPLCTGGDLEPQRLILAYSFGIFPWFDFTEPVPSWWAPLSRFVLFPEEIHISHSMRTLLNKRKYRVTVNEAFPEVIEACRTVNGRYEDSRGPWLGKDIVKAYTELWRMGHVKSVEVWDIETGKLSGGLYGVWINGCFMGESMFSYVPSGSKIALIGLCEWMKEQGGKVIDLQIETEHLKSMGGRYISYMDYMRMLNPEAAEGKDYTLPDLWNADKEVIKQNPLFDISYT